METRNEAMLIDGTWRPASDGGTVEIENPANRTIIATVPKATHSDLQEALDAAERVRVSWSDTSAWERSTILRRAAEIIRERVDSIAQLLTIEQGKPLPQARGEVHSAADQFDWYADEARRIYGRTIEGPNQLVRTEVRQEAIGPVAAFTPWNFPVMLAARKLAPALAAGCPVILKPAEEAPSACLAMVRAVHDAGVPAGVLAAVTGDPAFVSATLLDSPVIRKVSLTGSVRVGQIVMGLAAKHMAAVSFELGGHAPVIVCDDVDVKAVAAQAARTKYQNSGQICVSPTRFLVARSILDEFEAEFTRASAALALGDGMDAGSELGPLCSARRHDDFAALVEDALARGAVATTGGTSLREELGGHFYAPTVLRDIPKDARVLQEEPFGPLALIVAYDELEEAVEIANNTNLGLAGYLFTDDISRAQLLSEKLRVGMVGVNTFAIANAASPFSGVGLSGMGAESGVEGIQMYLRPKTVMTGISDSLR